MSHLTIVAAANSEAVRVKLKEQLARLDFVRCQDVVIELAEAFKLAQATKPDVLIVDITGREFDGGLFIEAMSSTSDFPVTIFALHENLDHKIILEAIRQGAKEFIQYPDDPQSLETALQRQQARQQRLGPAAGSTKQVVKEHKIISLFSSKGGAGTSTIAVNLAYELATQTNDPVLLLDMDQVFSNISVMLNIRPTYSLRDLAGNAVSDIDDSLLKSVVVPHDSGLHILVGSKNILDDTEMIPLNVLENVLQRLKEKYAYIVVDLPTHILDPYHQYLVDQSDMVLLVSCLDIPGLYRTRQYMDLARQHIDLNKVKLILNRWNLKAAYGMSNKNLEEEFRYPVYFRLPNDWDLNVEANSLGNVFSRLNPNADLSKSIQKLAAMVAARDPSAVGEAEQGKNNTKSLLTGFFKKK